MRELFPELAAEPVALLEENGERELAISARDFRLVAGCGCGDDFCQSFYTGAGTRVPTAPAAGASLFFLRRAMLNPDVVNGRIMHVEGSAGRHCVTAGETNRGTRSIP